MPPSLWPTMPIAAGVDFRTAAEIGDAGSNVIGEVGTRDGGRPGVRRSDATVVETKDGDSPPTERVRQLAERPIAGDRAGLLVAVFRSRAGDRDDRRSFPARTGARNRERPRQVQPARRRDDDVLGEVRSVGRRGVVGGASGAERADGRPAHDANALRRDHATQHASRRRDGEIHRRARVLHPHRVRTEAAHGSRERLRPADDEDHDGCGVAADGAGTQHDLLDEAHRRIHDGDRTGNAGDLGRRRVADLRHDAVAVDREARRISRALRRPKGSQVHARDERRSVQRRVVRDTHVAQPVAKLARELRRRSILALLEDRIAAQEQIERGPFRGRLLRSKRVDRRHERGQQNRRRTGEGQSHLAVSWGHLGEMVRFAERAFTI